MKLCAFTQFLEVSSMFNGKIYSIITSCTKCHNVTNERFDFNYKDICLTITNIEGLCYVSPRGVELYNSNGNLMEIYNFF